MIKGNNISWSFKTKQGLKPILKEVSFRIKAKRITTFMGPSGAGKTSLLKCLANLYGHYTGHIFCHGTDLRKLSAPERTSKIGFVLQQFHLFPHLTALQNCAYALVHVANLSAKNADFQAAEMLHALGMTPYIHSFPAQLSGGQQQRVAIARALVLKPDALLLDEPTSSLDPESKHTLESLLLKLHAEGMTIALSSHDMPFIKKIMDYVYFMEKGTLTEEWDKEATPVQPGSKIFKFLSHGEAIGLN